MRPSTPAPALIVCISLWFLNIYCPPNLCGTSPYTLVHASYLPNKLLGGKGYALYFFWGSLVSSAI